MKKEVLFAVFVGIVVGLIIMFGVYRARLAMDSATTTNSQIENSLTTPPSSPVTESSARQDAFVVSEPQDESIVSVANIRVTGQAFPNAAIIILNANTETVGTADTQGNFSIALTLQAGANPLVIRALGTNHDPSEVTRTVIFSTADLNATASAILKK